jgi:hypothetical protein
MISVKHYNEAVHEYTQNVFRFLMKSLKDKQAAEMASEFMKGNIPYVVPIDPQNF